MLVLDNSKIFICKACSLARVKLTKDTCVTKSRVQDKLINNCDKLTSYDSIAIPIIIEPFQNVYQISVR